MRPLFVAGVCLALVGSTPSYAYTITNDLGDQGEDELTHSWCDLLTSPHLIILDTSLMTIHSYPTYMSPVLKVDLAYGFGSYIVRADAAPNPLAPSPLLLINNQPISITPYDAATVCGYETE